MLIIIRALTTHIRKVSLGTERKISPHFSLDSGTCILIMATFHSVLTTQYFAWMLIYYFVE